MSSHYALTSIFQHRQGGRMTVTATKNTRDIIDEITVACTTADQVLVRSRETLAQLQRFQAQLQRTQPVPPMPSLAEADTVGAR